MLIRLLNALLHWLDRAGARRSVKPEPGSGPPEHWLKLRQSAPPEHWLQETKHAGPMMRFSAHDSDAATDLPVWQPREEERKQTGSPQIDPVPKDWQQAARQDGPTVRFSGDEPSGTKAPPPSQWRKEETSLGRVSSPAPAKADGSMEVAGYSETRFGQEQTTNVQTRDVQYEPAEGSRLAGKTMAAVRFLASLVQEKFARPAMRSTIAQQPRTVKPPRASEAESKTAPEVRRPTDSELQAQSDQRQPAPYPASSKQQAHPTLPKVVALERVGSVRTTWDAAAATAPAKSSRRTEQRVRREAPQSPRMEAAVRFSPLEGRPDSQPNFAVYDAGVGYKPMATCWPELPNPSRVTATSFSPQASLPSPEQAQFLEAPNSWPDLAPEQMNSDHNGRSLMRSMERSQRLEREQRGY